MPYGARPFGQVDRPQVNYFHFLSNSLIDFLIIRPSRYVDQFIWSSFLDQLMLAYMHWWSPHEIIINAKLSHQLVYNVWLKVGPCIIVTIKLNANVDPIGQSYYINLGIFQAILVPCRHVHLTQSQLFALQPTCKFNKETNSTWISILLANHFKKPSIYLIYRQSVVV